MNKKSQTKIMIFSVVFILVLIASVYALSVSFGVSTIPGNNRWMTDGWDNFTINFTITIDNYDNYESCGAGGGANITYFNVSLYGEFPPGNKSEFGLNQTYNNVQNGTTAQFNVTHLPQSPAGSGWNYYLITSNVSNVCNHTGGANASVNFSQRSSIYNIRIDTISPVITLNFPLAYTNTAGNFTTNSVYFNFTTIETNPNICYLHTNETGAFRLNHSWAYKNNSVEEVTVDNFPDGYVAYFYNCTDDVGNIGYSSNRTFFMDSIVPTISEITTNNSWSKTAATILQANVTEAFKGECALWGSFVTAGNTTLELNQTNTTFTSGEHVSFTVNLGDTVYPTGYLWNMTCNDSLGNGIGLSTRGIQVDTTIPLNPRLNSLKSQIYSTDHTPNITHIPSIENNFLTYVLNFYEADGTFYGQVNNSVNNSYGSIFTTYLASDTNYTYNLSVYDRAGNFNTTEFDNSSTSYQTDSTCWNLSEGYNFCGIIRDELHNLTTIADESKAQYVYTWNGTWVTFTAGSSTNANYQLQRGDVAIIYINSTGPYEWEDRVWSQNTTMTGSVLGEINMTNSTGSPYTFISIAQNDTGVNFTQLEYSFTATTQGFEGGNSIQYLTFVNNSALGDSNNNQQYYPFRFGKNFNEYITIGFGEVIIAYNSNATSVGSIHTNWTRAIGGAG